MSKLTPQTDTLSGKVARQTFLYSATMANDYDRYLSKELLFGKGNTPIECGDQNSEGKDSGFTATVLGLKQNFILIP